jgi:myo-inositol-1(or 4)-monophosphatase
VTVSAVGEGSRDERFVAERGSGAYQVTPDGQTQVHASDESLVVGLSVSTSSRDNAHQHSAEFARAAVLANRWDIRMLGTTGAFAYVAAGRIAGHLLFGLSSPVHSAAGCLLAEEAGAVVTDLRGNPWTVESYALLAAASPALHADLLSLVAATRP